MENGTPELSVSAPDACVQIRSQEPSEQSSDSMIEICAFIVYLYISKRHKTSAESFYVALTFYSCQFILRTFLIRLQKNLGILMTMILINVFLPERSVNITILCDRDFVHVQGPAAMKTRIKMRSGSVLCFVQSPGRHDTVAAGCLGFIQGIVSRTHQVVLSKRTFIKRRYTETCRH